LWSIRRGAAKSDQLWGVDVDREGNVYTAGYFQVPPNEAFFDIVVWKFGPDGSELWRSQWGEPFEDKAFVVTVAEPYVLVGGERRTSLSFTESRLLLLAFDMRDGHLAWQWEWSSGVGYHEVDGVVADGSSIYVSGWAGSARTSGDVAIAKLDLADGRQQWVRTWGSDKFDEADGQLVVDEQFLYVSGRYAGEPLTGGRALLAKFDEATGDYVAAVTWGNGTMSDGLSLASDGTSLYVTGFTVQNLNGQIILLKYDKRLAPVWERTWGGVAGESARAVAVDRSGNVLVAGHTFSRGSGESDIAVLGFDSAGNLLWEQLWGGPLHDEARALVVDGDFAYLAGETRNATAGMNDGLLLRFRASSGQMPPH
jgi:hypothetical protein